MRKQIPVDQLQIGMYVAELDRPWLGTRFAFQGFPITSQSEIASLSETCKTVFIDVEKSDAVAELRAPSAAPRYPEKVSVEQELVPARVVLQDCRRSLQKNLETLAAGGELDVESLKGSVEKIADSIERNPDAMLLLTKVRQKSETQFERALDVSVLMMTFGRFLQLAREQIDLLGMVGLLQDIGKLKVPDPILQGNEPLTPEARELAKAHVVHSAAMLREVRGLPPQLPELVMLHHERYDGSGYPRGLAGQAIGMVGWIAGIADSYSAMTHLRSYAELMSPSNALGVLYDGRGTLYHGALVEQFIQCIGIYPVGSIVQLNSGEIGVVIAQNRVRRLQPRVMVLLDADSKPITPQKMLDLIREPKLPSGEPYRIRRTLEASKLPLDPRDFFL